MRTFLVVCAAAAPVFFLMGFVGRMLGLPNIILYPLSLAVGLWVGFTAGARYENRNRKRLETADRFGESV